MSHFLTVDQFNAVSSLAISAIDYPLDRWIEAANSILSTFNFDESIEGFANSMVLVASGIVEHFYSGSRRNAIMATNSPFKSQRLGSFAYTLKTESNLQKAKGDIFENMPDYILYLISRYLKKPDPRISTTGVFQEAPANSDGIRPFDIDYEPTYG